MSNNKIRYIKNLYSPLIGIVASKDVEDICVQNNFNSIVDLLTPFGNNIKAQGKPFSYQDSQGQTITLNDFSLRFINYNQLKEQNYSNIDKVALELLKKYSNTKYSFDPLEKIKPNVGLNSNSKDDIEENSPWFYEYQQIINKSISISEHETFNHPIASFIFVSTNNANPLSTFTQLQNIIDNHQIFQTGYVDPNVIKHYILIHDTRVTSEKEIQNLKQQMKKLFGIQFDILTLDFNGEKEIKENNEENQKLKSDFWLNSMIDQKYINMLYQQEGSSSESSSPSSLLSPLNNEGLPLFNNMYIPDSEYIEKAKLKEYGRLLSLKDNQNIKVFISEFISLTLLPFMERSIHHLNEQVASSRRGISRFFNAGRKYFGTGSKQVQQSMIASVVNGLNRYSYQAPEAQMRKLADFSFMLCDYRFAYSVYDNVKKDFNNSEMDIKYYAGTQGMIVLCLLMCNSVKLNIDTIMENSIINYNKSKSLIYSLRSTFVYIYLLKHLNQYKKIAQAFLRITTDDSNVRSAIFLEQASYCYLKPSLQMIRKYAFHMILAGHRYSRCGNREHAFRCYFTAYKVYKDKNWTLIEDHINFTLGRQSFHLADLNLAVEYFLKLLHGSRQSAAQQNAYMKEFLYIYKQYIDEKKEKNTYNGNEENCVNLSLPIIDDTSTKVLLFDTLETQREEQILNENVLNDNEWEVLDSLVSIDNLNSPISNGHSLISNGNTCTIGEPVYVVFDIRNPMQIPLEINNLILECELEPSSESENQTINSAYENNENFVKFQYYLLEKIDFIRLNSNSSAKIKIIIIPKAVGTLKIRGIKYSFFNLVQSVHLFTKQGKRLNNTLDQRMKKVYSEDTSLVLTVTPPMPLLDIIFHSKPTSILAGETTKLILEINNKGNCELTNLKLVMNQNSLIYIGSPEMINDDIYDISNNCETSMMEKMEINNKLENQKVYDIILPTLDNNTKGLLPGNTTLIPIWIHYNQIGKHSQKFLFNYYSETNEKSKYVRSLKYMINIQVLPSLRINAFTRQSSSKLNEFLLGIEVENLLNETAIQLQQLSINSPSWKLMKLKSKIKDEIDYTIEPHQTTVMYYRLSHLTDEEQEKDDNVLPEIYSCEEIEKFLFGEKSLSREHKIKVYSTHLKCSSDNLVLLKNNALKSFILISKYIWRMKKLSVQYTHIPQKVLPDLFTLYQTEDVDLLVFWENKNTKVKSHQFIPGINLGIQQSPLQYSNRFKGNAVQSVNMISSKALYSQTAQKKKDLMISLMNNKSFKDISPVRINIKAKNIINHDFSLNKICQVDIKISLKNCSFNKTAEYKLNMITRKNQNSNDDDNSDQAEFSWIGKASTSGILKSNEEKHLFFKACITKSGVYNINKWNLKVNTKVDYSDENKENSYNKEIKNKNIINDSDEGLSKYDNTYIQNPTNSYYINIIDSNNDKL